MIALSDTTRPFYEYGVWRGISFKYLIKSFKKGFGFDTFTGLPEDWHHEKAGTYSSQNQIPNIPGGDFIIGKFEESLPNFFRSNAQRLHLLTLMQISTINYLCFEKLKIYNR